MGNPDQTKRIERPAQPPWMRVKLPLTIGRGNSTAAQTRKVVRDGSLHTVCEEAACPNLGHCWNQGTATFMIMGDRCTRRCSFCDIQTARPLALDPSEPERLANAIQQLQLQHAVITSVDRDELKDCGSKHFADCIRTVKAQNPGTIVEVLIPDFKARPENLQRVFDAQPHIINHNVETVPSLFNTICPQSNYRNSLSVLAQSRAAGFVTKSGLILGLGEELEEVRQVIGDLASIPIDMLTIGQYLQPGAANTNQGRFLEPQIFADLKVWAQAAGIQLVESGPLVRSSYHARDSWIAIQKIFRLQG
ncbi:MAG: lipoyl synthase [Leptospiraceae bacterium]|nr:lipoyl synthase [Leptospiraceae bacterium]